MIQRPIRHLLETWRAALARWFGRMRPRVPSSGVASWVPASPDQLIRSWQAARNAQSLGFVLNQARLAKGLSILQLQTVTGVNATYLVKLEHNLLDQPSLFVLVQLAEALDLPVDDLVGRLGVGSYSPEDLLALERRWRLAVLAQPGDRNGQMMLSAIAMLWRQTAYLAS